MPSLHFIDGEWKSGNPPIFGPESHAGWMASVVFDGARSFEGTAPDLEMHCERAVASAEALLLRPKISGPEIAEIARDGIARFPKETALYIRPMFYADSGFIEPDPESTRFVMSLLDWPMPEPNGFTACKAITRRPLPDMATTDAKAACLYPNAARAIADARQRGFDNAVVLDGLGNVAEFCTSNLFFAKDGAAHTPVANGTFLNGITRQRVIALLREAGVPVHERVITYDELLDADEVFSTGNYAKVVPVTKLDDRSFQPGPVCAQARELYWSYSHESGAL